MDNNRLTLVYIYLISIIIMLFLSFFFSSSDMSYGSIDLEKVKREYNKNKNKKSYYLSYRLSKNYDKTISTILLLNDTVNAGLDSFSTLLGVNLCYVIFSSSLTSNELSIKAETWGLIASIICLLIKITFGEIIAKSIGKIYNYKLSRIYSYIIRFFDILLTPLTFLVSSFGKIVTYPLTHNIKDVTIIEDDLHNMVDEIESQGNIDEDQAFLLHETINYTTTKAYQIMTPRVDFYSIDIDDDIYEIIKDPKLYRFTRVPVYKDTIDNCIGYVNTKKLIIESFKNSKIDLYNYLQTPLKFPKTIEINEILKTFKKTKEHFALIIDEYGGIDGLLTMEDILEEFVGDIWDEKDDPDALFIERKDGSFIVDGMMDLKDFTEKFDLDYDEIDSSYVTLGGFCIELLDDKFAKINDVITYKDLKMKVIALDKNNSIKKLLVTINKKEEEDKPLFNIIDKE